MWQHGEFSRNYSTEVNYRFFTRRAFSGINITSSNVPQFTNILRGFNYRGRAFTVVEHAGDNSRPVLFQICHKLRAARSGKVVALDSVE